MATNHDFMNKSRLIVMALPMLFCVWRVRVWGQKIGNQKHFMHNTGDCMTPNIQEKQGWILLPTFLVKIMQNLESAKMNWKIYGINWLNNWLSLVLYLK